MLSWFRRLWESLRAQPQPRQTRVTRHREGSETLEPRCALSAAPVITDFTAIEGWNDTWALSGYVADEQPGSLVVNFGGVAAPYNRSATTDAQGQFNGSYLFEGIEEGTITAATVDNENLSSNVVSQTITPTHRRVQADNLSADGMNLSLGYTIQDNDGGEQSLSVGLYTAADGDSRSTLVASTLLYDSGALENGSHSANLTIPTSLPTDDYRLQTHIDQGNGVDFTDGTGTQAEFYSGLFINGDSLIVHGSDDVDSLMATTDEWGMLTVTFNGNTYSYDPNCGPTINTVYFYGHGGDDSATVSGVRTVMYGGTGNDVLIGGLGDDELHGGAGEDSITGGGGNDVVWGGTGANVISSGDGTTTIQDAIGVNQLYVSGSADLQLNSDLYESGTQAVLFDANAALATITAQDGSVWYVSKDADAEARLDFHWDANAYSLAVAKLGSGTVQITGVTGGSNVFSFTNIEGVTSIDSDLGQAPTLDNYGNTTAAVTPCDVNVQGGQLIFQGDQHLHSLTIANGGGVVVIGEGIASGTHILYTRGLTIAEGGVLDLTYNHLAVAYDWSSVYADVNSCLGTRIISSDEGYDAALRNLMTADNANLQRATMFGRALGATGDFQQVIVTLVYQGDANLDGKVNIDDLVVLDGYDSQVVPYPQWTDGDFNADGVVDSADRAVITDTFADGVHDMMLTGFHPDETGAITIEYRIYQTSSVQPFTIHLYRSMDGTTNGTSLYTYTVSDSGLLTEGKHTLTFSPEFTDPDADGFLVAAVEDGGNSAPSEIGDRMVFEGGIFLNGEQVIVEGTQRADTVDVVDAANNQAIIILSEQTYTLTSAASNPDVIVRLHGGNDSVHVHAASQVYTGAGQDLIQVSAANSTVDCGAGDDVILSDAEFTTLRGGDGNDQFWLSADYQTVFGGNGDDSFTGWYSYANIQDDAGANSFDLSGGPSATNTTVNFAGTSNGDEGQQVVFLNSQGPFAITGQDGSQWSLSTASYSGSLLQFRMEDNGSRLIVTKMYGWGTVTLDSLADLGVPVTFVNNYGTTHISASLMSLVNSGQLTIVNNCGQVVFV